MDSQHVNLLSTVLDLHGGGIASKDDVGDRDIVGCLSSGARVRVVCERVRRNGRSVALHSYTLGDQPVRETLALLNHDAILGAAGYL